MFHVSLSSLSLFLSCHATFILLYSQPSIVPIPTRRTFILHILLVSPFPSNFSVPKNLIFLVNIFLLFSLSHSFLTAHDPRRKIDVKLISENR